MTTNLPIESVLFSDRSQYQYSDSLAIPIQRTKIESWELISVFFQSSPSWVNSLFVIRNWIVRYLNLQTGSYNQHDLKPPYQIGQKIGLFRVITIIDNEVVIGEDDNHLNFRTSLLLIDNDTNPKLVVSTLVKTKNKLGIVYFSVVKHFHRLIVPVIVKTMAKKIDERSFPYIFNGTPHS